MRDLAHRDVDAKMHVHKPGGVVEWLMAPVLKTGRAKALVGSNPTPSANQSTSDRVTAANAGEHFPKCVQDAVDSSSRSSQRSRRLRTSEQRAFGGGVFAIGFDVNGEIIMVPRVGHLVVFDQTFDLRLRNRGNLALVRVKGRESFGGRAQSKPRNVPIRFGLIPFYDRLHIFLRYTEALGELQPQLRMIRRAGFFIDKIIEQLLARRLILAARVHSGEIESETPRHGDNTGARNRPEPPGSAPRVSRPGKTGE